MSSTPNLTLPYILAQQAQKHVTHNEAIRALDCLLQLSVADRDLAAPPASPADGDRFIPAAGASGAWTGHAGKIAAYQDAAWIFYSPEPGWVAWVADEAILVAWTGAAWIGATGGGASVNPTPFVGVNATADTTNRLAVSSPATLFNHAGSSHQLKINKAAPGDTGSLVYQTGFSGRTELGLAGDDDFRVKVSADGTAWKEAIQVDRSSGTVSLPFTTALAAPNLLVNGDFAINQRTFAGGALAAGIYGYDRWKAGTTGASLSLANGILTLTSGELRQIVETSVWGHTSLAATALTLSVENLTGGNLSVAIGQATGTITAGSGLRSVTLTTAAGDTGNLTVKIAPTAGAVSFRRVKLEAGPRPTAWQARPQILELALCRRYFEQLSGLVPDRPVRRSPSGGAGNFFVPIGFFGAKRVAPTVTLINLVYGSASGATPFNATTLDFELFVTFSAGNGYVFFGYAADAEL